MKKPKNNLYMTDADSTSFGASFGEMYSNYTGEHFTELCVKNVTIVLTEECNLRCTYCYQHGKNKVFLTKEKAKDIVEFLLNPSKHNGYIDLEKHKCVILDFIGGEPMLNIEVMDYFMDYFKMRAIELEHPWAYNYMISMSSNGTLYLTDEFQNFMKKNDGRVDVGITIDGNKKLHDSCRIYKDGTGSYDDVLKSVKVWIKDRQDPTTKVTLAPQNLDYLVDSVTHLWDLGVFSVPANVVFEDVWCKSDATKFYYKLKELADITIDRELFKHKHTTLFKEQYGMPMSPEENGNYCGGTGDMLAIGHDGRTYPCLRYMKYSLSNKDRKEMCIGNIYDGIETEQENKQLAELQCITRRSQSTDECFNCPIATGCAWCSAYNYDVFGTANKRATFHCDMHKAQVMANVYYWNKLYKKLNIDKKFEMHIPEEWALEIIDEKEYNMLLLTQQH
ncbi:MAG: radical SAM peptide maturase, CXXX-repeat target family [Vallitalea sp.]|jgi:uncharacterized protein|nr:radical SAM peptide maturase, CXXX-repeat target family [Vallitalea sp.]